MAYVPSTLIQQRRRREDAVRAHQEKVDYFRQSELRSEFEQRTDKRIAANTLRRKYDSLSARDEAALSTRRSLLKARMEAESVELSEEVAHSYETPEQRIASMRARADALRREREAADAAYAQEQMDRRWRAECDEIRHLRSVKLGAMVEAEREEQIAAKARQREMEAEREAQYAAQWEASRRAKIEREVQDAQRKEALTREMMGTLEQQMGEKAAARAKEEEIKAQEAELLAQQWELDQIAAGRRKAVAAAAAAARRGELDYYNQLSMARREEEAARERENDIRIIEDLIEAERGVEEREAASRAALKAEALQYRSHLLRQMEKEKADEARLDALRQDQLEAEWAKRQAQWDKETRAREALMADVFEARRQQIARKLAAKAEERREQVLAGRRLEAEMAAAEAAAAQESANQMAKEREYKRSLLIQAERRSAARDREQERERREYEAMKAERDAYERRLAKELMRDVDLGDFRRSKASVYYGDLEW